MQLVQATGLIKTFSRLRAVDGVSLSVNRGEVVGFLGPNGAGKSTTMKMLTGFLEPDAGTATIAGHDVFTDVIAARRHLGYLPEGAPAYGDMTVADFLTFIGRMRGLSKSVLNERLAEMVDRVNLVGVWNRQIDALSKGFKRRVGIAQALLHDPEVLILDEPTDGLDPNQKHDMRDLIAAIAPGKAIVISTHILEEVEAICSRVVIIADGRVVADATPAALLDGATVGNALELTLAGTDAATALSALSAAIPGARVEPLEAESGRVRLLVTADGALTAVALADKAVAAGFAVDAVGVHRPTLETVFRDITGSKAA